jgi:hypothetical protein
MGRSSIPDIQFKGDDRDPVRLEKLRRLAEAVQSIARQIDQPGQTAPSTPGTSITMTGPGVLGRLTGTGSPLTLTGVQVASMLPLFSTANKGLVPSPGEATGFRFLKDDGAWGPITIPPGSLQHGLLAGLTANDHPQYVLRDILTTKGDLFVHDGTSIVRIGIGTDGQILKVVTGDVAWMTASPTVTLTGSVTGTATMTNLGSISIDAQAVSPRYLVQNTASRAWLLSELTRGLNIIGVRFAGPALIQLPHALPVEYAVTVKAEHVDARITVKIY